MKPNKKTTVTPQPSAPQIDLQASNMQNPTADRNEPITGGDQTVIVSNIIVRQTLRQLMDMATYKTGVLAAENVYNPIRAYLYDQYQHSLLDGHLFGIIEKRINTVLNKTLNYYNPEGEKVEELDQFIESLEFRKICRLIIESVMWGISGIEFIPGPKLRINEIPRKHISPKMQLIHTEQYNIKKGYDYTKLDNVWIIGETDNLGILLPACMYAIYKRNALAAWSNFIEIFGIPIRVAKYDVNDQSTQAALQSALDKAGSALSLLVPKQAEFEIQDGKTSNANGDLQAQFVDKMDQFMSIVILGNTETTTNGKTGSQAKSKVHQDQQNEILKSDMKLIENYLNSEQFTKILNSYGIPVTNEGQFRFNRDIDIAFLQERIQVDKELYAMLGDKIDPRYFFDTYNIPVNESPEHEKTEGNEINEDKDKKTEPKETELNDKLTQYLTTFFQ